MSDHSSDSKREQPKKKKLFAFCSVGNLGFFGEETLYKRAVRQYTAISECYSILYKISSKVAIFNNDSILIMLARLSKSVRMN